MHGDIDRPESIVLTRDEYDAFANSERGRVMLNVLRQALMAHTVLFLGFGLTDPHFLRVFGEAGWLAKGYQGEAYAVMTETSHPEREEWARRNLRIIPIDSYEDLPDITRKLAGEPVPLEQKVLALGDRRRDAQVICLGSVYLDLELRPVDIDDLSARKQEEWTNVKSSLRIGGSAWYVQDYLKTLKCKARLVTKIGNESKEFFAERHIEPLRAELASTKGLHTAMTVHLIQCNDDEGEEPTANIMLTDTGALKALGWDNEIQQRISTLEDGGVLYLSGYFKTALHQGLREKLKELDCKKVITCLDHGRFKSQIVGADWINPLRESLKWVDIYLCTTDELKELFQGMDPKMKRKPVEYVLEFLDEYNQRRPKLPKVMLVRDNKGQENERLIARIKSRHGCLYAYIPVRRVQTGPERFVGVGNAFHARFIHCMLNDERCENLTPAIIEWALRAQRMVEWVMSHDNPATFDQELVKFAQDCDKCGICAKVAQKEYDKRTNNHIQLLPPKCPYLTKPGGQQC